MKNERGTKYEYKRIIIKRNNKKLVRVVMLLIVAILSLTVISKVATSPESYASTIQSIDEKKTAVTGVTAAVTMASTSLAAIPGDATTPIANKISDMIYEVNKATIEVVTSNIDEGIDESKGKKEKSWLEKMVDKTKDGVSDIGEKAKQILNRFIDAIALFIVAYCALPIIIIFLVIWFINFLFGLSVSVPKVNLKRLTAKNNNGEQEKERIEM